MQILATKLSTPPLRSKLVPRLRLIQKLNHGLECSLILVSAPAGYGKSTLLSAWLNQLEFPSVWLSLDENDNDPYRFVAYLNAACHQIDPSTDFAVESRSNLNPQPEIEVLLTPLINHLAGLTQPCCLVLDDYHLVQEHTVHQFVTFLLEHHPEQFHLVISTRADPPLPLAKLRAKGEMLELRMADLRFTSQEAADFLNRTMGLKVSLEDVSRITQRTEGWIAGLQMAALSMQNMTDVSGFISAFTGSHHYIFDYLLDEILGKQSPEIHRFLLYTSILDQLCAPLCDNLLANGNSVSLFSSASILEELDHSNLFIIPLDHEQHWYRYHPLFAELLRGYLQKNEPAQIPVLHTRASIWYEQHGMISEAIRHSFAISDWERSVRLISGNIFALLEQNELTTVARQLEYLIGENTEARPWLLIAHAWLMAYTGQLKAVDPILKETEAEIDNLKSEVAFQTLGGHIAAIRAYTNWIEDRREIAAKSAQVALEWLPPSDRLIRCHAATLLGLTLPSLNARAKALEQALSYAKECSVSHVTIFAHGCWAWLLTMQGRLHEAYAACQEAIRLAQSAASHTSLPTLSHVYSTLSAIVLEWNDVENALQYAKEAVDLARRWEQADALHFALNNYGYALFASNDVEGAFDTLRQSWQVARRTSTWFEQITLAQEIEWYLLLDNLDAAIQCLRRAHLDIDEPTIIPVDSYQSVLLPFTFVQIYLAQKQHSKALKLIALLLEDMEKKQIGYYLIRLLLWQAQAFNGLKQEEAAMNSLKRSLILAAPEGYLHIFLIASADLLPLLRKARRAGITPEYTDMLLDALDLRNETLRAQSGTVPGLIEPLSGREMEVLKLLAQGCTDKKIAESLVIAPETVHKHLKNIYGKLEVHSRTEAVRRSNELGLL
jgi:LuxR family maltose regulon positive regulatory protein